MATKPRMSRRNEERTRLIMFCNVSIAILQGFDTDHAKGQIAALTSVLAQLGEKPKNGEPTQ